MFVCNVYVTTLYVYIKLNKKTSTWVKIINVCNDKGNDQLNSTVL